MEETSPVAWRAIGGSIWGHKSSEDDTPLYTDSMNWRGKFERLMFDLWRDGILSEQQCASYAGTDLVAIRRTLDCQAALRCLKNRNEAEKG